MSLEQVKSTFKYIAENKKAKEISYTNYPTDVEGLKAMDDAMKNAYNSFGSEVYNQLFHQDAKMEGWDSKDVELAILRSYQKHMGQEVGMNTILNEIRDDLRNVYAKREAATNDTLPKGQA